MQQIPLELDLNSGEENLFVRNVWNALSRFVWIAFFFFWRCIFVFRDNEEKHDSENPDLFIPIQRQQYMNITMGSDMFISKCFLTSKRFHSVFICYRLRCYKALWQNAALLQGWFMSFICWPVVEQDHFCPDGQTTEHRNRYYLFIFCGCSHCTPAHSDWHIQ